MKYYNDNISKIKYEYKFFEKFRDLINKNRLIGINQNFNISQIEKCFVFLVDKTKKSDNTNIDLNKDNPNIDIEKSNYNLLQNDDNIFINDKMLLELDKLFIKPKFEYNLSVNSQRI